MTLLREFIKQKRSEYTDPIVGNLILDLSRNDSDGVHVVDLVLQVMQLVNQTIDGLVHL